MEKQLLIFLKVPFIRGSRSHFELSFILIRLLELGEVLLAILGAKVDYRCGLSNNLGHSHSIRLLLTYILNTTSLVL